MSDYCEQARVLATETSDVQPVSRQLAASSPTRPGTRTRLSEWTIVNVGREK